MKNAIKRIVIGVLIGIILMFIGRIMPKAESYTKTSLTFTCRVGDNCQNGFSANAMTYIFPQKDNIYSTEVDFAVNPVQISDYDGFKVTIAISEYNIEYFEIYNEYPSAYTWTGSNPESYTITYADGTQAQVRGGAEINGWRETSTSSVNYNYGTVADTTVAYSLGYRSNGSTANYNQCFMESANDNQITWNCPKTTNGGIQQLSELVIKIRYRTDMAMTLFLDRFNINLYKTDGTRVITQIQQSTQSIVDAINNGNQATQDAIEDNTQATQEQTQAITSSDTTSAQNDASGIINNSAFNDNTGLSSVISMPLTFINNLSNTCQPINLTLPYMDYNFQIPCLQEEINRHMPALVVVIKTLVNGLIIYWIMLDIFNIVHKARDPQDDRIEVVEL